ncbi:MAG: putative aminohydrolase SsnA [Anaerolineae bacterium]
MLITNATLVNWGDSPTILSDYALYIKNGMIDAIGPTEVLIPNYRDERQLDAKGQYVFPGNICAHTHFYGTFSRGMPIPGAPAVDFPQILQKLWWPLDKALDHDAVNASALLCLVDAIKSGTTTLIDHHASPNAIEGSLDTIMEAVDRAGLRAVLCYEVTDRDGQAKAEAGIAENVRFINAQRNHSRIRGTFGLHASLTLTDDTLRACVDALPEGAGFHIHVAEHEADQEDSLSKYGRRVVQRLSDFSILGDRTITAHCIHVDDGEIALLKGTGTWITHQPRSNMNNGVGAMHLKRMLDNEMRVCLGNDGFSNDMWAEWKAAYLLHKVVNRDPREANGAKIAHMALRNNAQLAQVFFPEQRIGELVEGAAADLIFVDYKPFTPLSVDNLPWHILFGFDSSLVTTTIVAGEILMQDRQLVTLNEDAIVADALELAPQIWRRYQEYAGGRG